MTTDQDRKLVWASSVPYLFQKTLATACSWEYGGPRIPIKTFLQLPSLRNCEASRMTSGPLSYIGVSKVPESGGTDLRDIIARLGTRLEPLRQRCQHGSSGWVWLLSWEYWSLVRCLKAPPAHHSHPPPHNHCSILGSKLTCSTNLFHHSLLALDCLLGLYWTGLLCSTVIHF